jgi:nitrate reductase beta subunit
VYALAHRYRVALPLHPEYRTLPMVWYVPPLSPITNTLETDGYEADPDQIFPAIESMRIPIDYLANLLAAGDARVIRDVLRRLAAMRGHMRKREVLCEHDLTLPETVGMSVDDVEDMYRLLAIARYDDRYVIPKAHAELADRLMEQQGSCGLDFEGGPGNCGAVPGPIAAPIPDGPSGTDTGGFMLTDEDPSGLDIVQIAADGRRIEGQA